MTPVSSASPPKLTNPELGPKIYTVGTLRYTQREVFILFAWLMGTDFCFTLMEQIRSLTSVIYKDNGASNTIIGLFATITGFATIWINPVLSTFSDRYRGRYGRRRPFLLLATPPFVILIVLLPFMPDFGRWLDQYPLMISLLHHLQVSPAVLMVGVCLFFMSLFNTVLLTLFSYYHWDVIPESVLGRFNGISKTVTMGAAFLWSFFLFGLADRHMKALFVLTAASCAVIFMLSIWNVKEGQYPPPELRHSRSLWEPVITYCKDCFSESRYLWVFLGFTIYQTGNMGNDFQFYYVHYDLGINLDTIGKFRAIPSLVFMLAGYGLGVLTDKLKPVRLLPRTLMIYAIMDLLSYYYVHGKWSFLISTGLIDASIFAYSVVIGAFTVEVYPREKLGQFCSACATVYVFVGLVLSTPVGMFFDHIHSNRFGYLWSASFQAAAALIFYKVYHNWLRQQREHPTILALEMPSHIDDDALNP